MCNDKLAGLGLGHPEVRPSEERPAESNAMGKSVGGGRPTDVNGERGTVGEGEDRAYWEVGF